MNERKMEKIRAARELHRDADELERFFAMSWGSPGGLIALSTCFAILLLSTGVFLWLLHLANIIK